MPVNRQKTRPAGFTLIELLVVISIIALLVGILLPALGAARSTAQSAVCKSSLKQLGIAFETYAMDNDGVWPIPYAPAPFRLYPRPAPAETIPVMWNRTFMYPYMEGNSALINASEFSERGDKTVFVCPEGGKSFDAAVNLGFLEEDRDIDDVSKTSYAMNAAMVPLREGAVSIVSDWRASRRLLFPSETMVLIDHIHTNALPGHLEQMGNDGQTSIMDAAALRHRGSLNTLFADGHVTTLTPEDIPGEDEGNWYNAAVTRTDAFRKFWIGE